MDSGNTKKGAEQNFANTTTRIAEQKKELQKRLLEQLNECKGQIGKIKSRIEELKFQETKIKEAIENLKKQDKGATTKTPAQAIATETKKEEPIQAVPIVKEEITAEEPEAPHVNLEPVIENKTAQEPESQEEKILEENPVVEAREEKTENLEKIDTIVEQIMESIEEAGDEKAEAKFLELQPLILESQEEDKKTRILGKIRDGMHKVWKKKMFRFVILPLIAASAIAFSKHSPQEYWDMFNNWKERHWDKSNEDDPTIKGLSALYSDTTNTEKSTYDFLGDHKIEYKSGYYMTSVFDLSDQTPPRFKLINGRENRESIDSAAGITTNLFKKFQAFNAFKPELKGHTGKGAEAIGDIPVIGYNMKTQMMHAGHYKDFDDNWLVSETYEIPLNFKLNTNGTLNLRYHEQALRMVPVSINENGKEIPFPIGVTFDEKTKEMKPSDCTRFGTLEGGKVIMVCGDKQLQVNGSFSDMFHVYERLQREYKGVPIQAYLLDNGSYNLPIWDKDNTLSEREIQEHLSRNADGGTALILMNDERISPYEYKNKYKEVSHHSPNYTLDSITHKPAKNEKSVIVIHHTGNYGDPNQIIREFEDTTTERSAHVLIMKDGTRHLFNTDNYVMAHAGKSDFNDRNKVNYFSLGIEMEGDTKDGKKFTVAQLESMLEYMRPRIEKYKISLENITTHKIIRDNYLKKHPNEKGVLPKEDLDDGVWKEIRNLIEKKLYAEKKLDSEGRKAVAVLIYREGYRQKGSELYSLNKVRQALAEYKVSKEEIDETVAWLTGSIA